MIDDTYVNAFHEDGTFKDLHDDEPFKWRSKHSVADFGYYGANDLFMPRSNDFFITSIVNNDPYSSMYWVNSQNGLISYYKHNIKPLFTDEANNILYYGQGRTLYAVQLNDGREIWRSELNKGAYINSLAIAPDRTIYVGMEQGPLYALDPVTHAVKWQYDEGTATWGNIIVDQQRNIYVAQDQSDVELYYIYKFSPSGQLLATTPVDQSASNLQMRTDGSFYFTFNRVYYSSEIPDSEAILIS